jgi:hypothetical protein
MADIAAGPIKDPTNLTSWTKLSLLAQVVISVIAIVSGALEFQMLQDVQAGTFDDDENFEDLAIANDMRQGIVAIAQLLILVTSGVLILMWIFRANFNAHRLGAAGMGFSPGWAVGWYFIPVANLWKPYQAMKEIWQASASPEHWESEGRSGLLPLWWTLWIVSIFVDNAALRLALRDDQDLEELFAANGVTLVSDFLAIPLAVVLLLVVRKVHRMQIEQAQLQSFT